MTVSPRFVHPRPKAGIADRLWAVIRSWLGGFPRAADLQWHRCASPAGFEQTIDGKPIQMGEVWRRWNGHAWEYQQDEAQILDIEDRW